MKLSLYYPVKPLYTTQKFGETSFLPYYKANGINFVGHNGIDMATTHGEPIRASHNGEAWYEIDNAQGHGVVVRTNEKFEYNGEQVLFKTIYWHMVDSSKEPKYRSPIEDYTDINKAGKQVKTGDIIGYANSTGLSSGDHLHFGLKPVAQNETSGTYYNAEQENGYNGAIDPQPFFNCQYAEDISLEAPIMNFNVNIHFGMRNGEVSKLQKYLKRLGYFNYPEITGFYGNETQKAVLNFQYEQGIVKFGVESMFGYYFGLKSRTALNNLLIKNSI